MIWILFLKMFFLVRSKRVEGSRTFSKNFDVLTFWDPKPLVHFWVHFFSFSLQHVFPPMEPENKTMCYISHNIRRLMLQTFVKREKRTEKRKKFITTEKSTNSILFCQKEKKIKMQREWTKFSFQWKKSWRIIWCDLRNNRQNSTASLCLSSWFNNDIQRTNLGKSER